METHKRFDQFFDTILDSLQQQTAQPATVRGYSEEFGDGLVRNNAGDSPEEV